MGYKTIVMLMERNWRAEQVDVAFQIARDMQAHLVGLHAVRPMTLPAYVLAEAGPAGETFKENQRAYVAKLGADARAAFEAAAARHSHRTIEWRTEREDIAGGIATSARYADLVVAAQPDPDDDWNGQAHDLQHSLALMTGRPVVFVPYAGRFPTVGASILVAWNASRESARAVADALPLLERARSVRTVAFNPGREHGEDPGADIALHLARHGVKVTAAHRFDKETGIGELILSEAAECSADLIVMGAYGHSRMRELVLGGATRTILDSMTVPVLMAH